MYKILLCYSMNLLPNTLAKSFTLNAFIIEYTLINELTPAEQIFLENFLC